VPLAAQDAFVNPKIPYGFLSRENIVALEKIIIMKNNVIEPREKILEHLYDNSDDFMDKPVQWPQFQLLPREYLEQGRSDTIAASRQAFRSFYNTPKVSEEKMIRQEWAKVFGIDIWSPYYKAKEVEAWVKDKCSVRVFKLKGKPEFSKGGFTYVFKTRF
jgi:predicted transcriptional regulator